MGNFSLPLDISIKERIHHDCAARVRKQLAAKADQPTTGYAELNAHAAVSMIVHVGDFALAGTKLFHDHANEFFWDVYREPLDWFHELAVDALGDNFRLADRKFIAFAAHHFQQNGELQFATARYFEGIGGICVFHAQRNVGQ